MAIRLFSSPEDRTCKKILKQLEQQDYTAAVRIWTADKGRNGSIRAVCKFVAASFANSRPENVNILNQAIDLDLRVKKVNGDKTGVFHLERLKNNIFLAVGDEMQKALCNVNDQFDARTLLRYREDLNENLRNHVDGVLQRALRDGEPSYSGLTHKYREGEVLPYKVLPAAFMFMADATRHNEELQHLITDKAWFHQAWLTAHQVRQQATPDDAKTEVSSCLVLAGLAENYGRQLPYPRDIQTVALDAMAQNGVAVGRQNPLVAVVDFSGKKGSPCTVFFNRNGRTQKADTPVAALQYFEVPRPALASALQVAEIEQRRQGTTHLRAPLKAARMSLWSRNQIHPTL